VIAVTDNDPNFALSKKCWEAELKGNGTASILLCDQPRRRTGLTWEIAFSTDPHLPTGEYLLNEWLSVKDAAGNSGYLDEPVSITVTNSGEADVEEPKILAIKPDKREYHAGESGMILFKITDNLSSFDVIEPFGYQWFCSTSLVRDLSFVKPEEALDWNWMAEVTRVPLCGGLHHVEGDWYGADFTIANGIPPGEYVLPWFAVRDAVGNTTRIQHTGTDEGEPKIFDTYRYGINGPDSGIAVATIRVVR
jgi:hypothetical protein